jgi:hypothetical protein
VLARKGFYDAAGGCLRHEEPLQVDLCYWAGLQRFADEGCRLGNPTDYLHPPDHPHVLGRPDMCGCTGCCPPVHGVAVVLANRDGAVSSLHLGDGAPALAGAPRQDQGVYDEPFWLPVTLEAIRRGSAHDMIGGSGATGPSTGGASGFRRSPRNTLSHGSRSSSFPRMPTSLTASFSRSPPQPDWAARAIRAHARPAPRARALVRAACAARAPGE